MTSSRKEPEWKQQCRRCRHHHISPSGRLWKCRVAKRIAYCADALLNRTCAFSPISPIRNPKSAIKK